MAILCELGQTLMSPSSPSPGGGVTEACQGSPRLGKDPAALEFRLRVCCSGLHCPGCPGNTPKRWGSGVETVPSSSVDRLRGLPAGSGRLVPSHRMAILKRSSGAAVSGSGTSPWFERWCCHCSVPLYICFDCRTSRQSSICGLWAAPGALETFPKNEELRP